MAPAKNITETRKEDKPVVEKTIAERMEEKVEFTAPFGSDLKDDKLFLCVNGEAITIKRGETVKIKRKFVEAYEHSREQALNAVRYQIEAQRQSGKALADL